jgi:hypothetical protein
VKEVHTRRVKLDRRLLDMRLHAIPRVDGDFQGPHHDDGRHDLVLALISQHLQHGYVIRLALWLLQYAPAMAHDNRVRGDGRLAALRVVDFAPVHICGFGGRGFEHVVECAELVREVFGELRRAHVDVG